MLADQEIAKSLINDNKDNMIVNFQNKMVPFNHVLSCSSDQIKMQ